MFDVRMWALEAIDSLSKAGTRCPKYMVGDGVQVTTDDIVHKGIEGPKWKNGWACFGNA